MTTHQPTLRHRLPALAAAAANAAILASAPAAHADTLRSSEDERGVITRIERGVFQIGLDNTLIMTYFKEGDQTLLRANTTLGGVLRYFARDNVAVSVHPAVLLRKAGEARDLGFQGVVWANAYLRLGQGMFATPGVGAGLFIGERDEPAEDVILRSSIVGGIVSFELPLVFFINRRFDVRAGPEFLFTFGSIDPDNIDSQSYMTVDGGFKVGIDYTF